MTSPTLSHPYVGMWVTADGRIRHHLLPNGRYDEARGSRESAYQGRYEVSGDHIEYWDDTGFTADGDFVETSCTTPAWFSIAGSNETRSRRHISIAGVIRFSLDVSIGAREIKFKEKAMTTTDIEQQLENLASPQERAKHLRGLAILKQIGGENFGGPVSQLARFSEDLARFTIQYPYGDVLSRDGLDLRTRQILTTATLLAHGSAQSQLSFHFNGLLNVGGTPGDIVDLLFISAGLIGFPTAINAVPIVRDIFAERGETNNTTEAQASPAIPDISSDRLAVLDRIAPEFLKWREQVLDEEIFCAVHLEPRLAHLASAAMLAARGKVGASFDAHIASALATGATHRDIVEMVIQLSVYSGFPAALNAAGRAKNVLVAPERSEVNTQKVRNTRDSEKRFEGGAATLAASGGSGADVVDSFKDIAPGLGRLIVAHCYGDIFSRSALDPKGRELGAISALAAQGTVAAERPLGVHIDAALNLGATREEIIETLFNIIPYAGYPLIEKALLIAHDRISLFNEKQAADNAS